MFGIEVNSFNRFKTFIKLLPKLEGKSYWYALRNTYEMSDNLFEVSGLVKASFIKNEPKREYLMNNKERDFLAKLPEKITIYRGMTLQEKKSNNFGISLTLDKKLLNFLPLHILETLQQII